MARCHHVALKAAKRPCNGHVAVCHRFQVQRSDKGLLDAGGLIEDKRASIGTLLRAPGQEGAAPVRLQPPPSFPWYSLDLFLDFA